MKDGRGKLNMTRVKRGLSAHAAATETFLYIYLILFSPTLFDVTFSTATTNKQIFI